MQRIGLLSDTHGFLNPRILDFFSDCSEIWHAGDIGSVEVAEKLSEFKPLKAVFGNIDGASLRKSYPEFQNFRCEDIQILMTHIGGYPGRYEPLAKQKIELYKPGIFISGHSHILKIIYDKKYNLLHINPGAAGIFGFHHVITCVRFVIDEKDIREMEIFEKQRSK